MLARPVLESLAVPLDLSPADALECDDPSLAVAVAELPAPAIATAQISGRADSGEDLTQGSILRHVIRLAIPSALANLFNFSYNFVNMLWLGRLGPSAIAVTSTYQYFFMVFVIFNQIVGLGSVSLIARTYGAHEYDDCRRLIGQTFAFKLVIAIAVMILGLTFQRWAWTAFGSAPEVIEQGLRYSTIMFWVIPIYFSTFTLNTALRGIGDMRRLMWISALSTVLNLLIDPLLIFPRVFIGPFPSLGITKPLLELPGMGLGVAGAAWASFGSIVVMFVMGLWFFTAGRTFIRVGWRDFFGWDWHTVWRILRIGTPPAVGENMNSIAQVVIGRVINIFGTSIFAANGINGTIFGLVGVPLSGVGQAVVTMVGQNLGGRKPARAERSVYVSLALTVAIVAVGLAVCYPLAPLLIHLFVPGHDTAALETARWGTLILRINVWAFLVMAVAGPIGAAFWGSGDTKPAMWSALIGTWCVQLPLIMAGVYLFHWSDPRYIWWASVASATVGAVYLMLVFRKGRWKTVKV